MSRLLAACLLLSTVVAAQSEARVERNVVYGMYSGLALLMDVHYPATPNGYGIVHVPGSAFASSLGYDATPITAREQAYTTKLTEAGYTVFKINHRAAPRFVFPAALEDTQRAVRFVRHNAKQYGINPDRIGGFGGSTGGYLLALTAMLGAKNDDEPDPVNKQPATLQALVLFAPGSDLRELPKFNADAVVPIAMFLGVPIPIQDKANANILKRASPQAFVTSSAPPVLLVHGDADQTVPYQQSVTFEAELRRANVPTKLITLPGGTHNAGFGAGNTPRPEWPDYLGEMNRWMDQYLKK